MFVFLRVGKGQVGDVRCHMPSKSSSFLKCMTIWYFPLYPSNTYLYQASQTTSFFPVTHQIRSVAQSCPTLWPHESQHARPPCPSLTPSSLNVMSIELVIPSSHLILCRPLLLMPPIPPSIRVFNNESTLRMRWPKYWSFSFSIIPSKEIPGLISFRQTGMPWVLNNCLLIT